MDSADVAGLRCGGHAPLASCPLGRTRSVFLVPCVCSVTCPCAHPAAKGSGMGS